MNNFIIAVNAVVPFLAYIAFGYGIKLSKMVDEDFMRKLNQMVFKAFFPIMMFYNLYDKDDSTTLDIRLVVVGVSSVILFIVILFLIVPRFVKEDKKRGVIIQGIYRSNFVLFAMPLTESLFGAEGRAVAAMMIAIIIPIYNVAAVVVLEYFRGGKPKPLDLLKKIITNPMIAGVLVGLVFVGLNIKIPSCLEKPISQFSALSTPLALFVLGGTLHFSSIKKNLKYIVPVLSTKMIIAPTFAVILTILLNFEPLERFVYLTMFATPIAASSYPMACNMGGDGELAGELVVISTAVSVVTIFIWIFVLKTIGLI